MYLSIKIISWNCLLHHLFTNFVKVWHHLPLNNKEVVNRNHNNWIFRELVGLRNPDTLNTLIILQKLYFAEMPIKVKDLTPFTHALPFTIML